MLCTNCNAYRGRGPCPACDYNPNLIPVEESPDSAPFRGLVIGCLIGAAMWYLIFRVVERALS